MVASAYYIQIHELQGALGVEDAAKVVGLYGGTRIYVPGKLKPDHKIVAELGTELAERLSAYIATGIGGLAVEVPMVSASEAAQRQDRLRQLASDPSLSEWQAALKAGVHIRTVRRMRAKLKAQLGSWQRPALSATE